MEPSNRNSAGQSNSLELIERFQSSNQTGGHSLRCFMLDNSGATGKGGQIFRPGAAHGEQGDAMDGGFDGHAGEPIVIAVAAVGEDNQIRAGQKSAVSALIEVVVDQLKAQSATKLRIRRKQSPVWQRKRLRPLNHNLHITQARLRPHQATSLL